MKKTWLFINTCVLQYCLFNTILSSTKQQQRNEVNGGDEQSEFYLDGVPAVVTIKKRFLYLINQSLFYSSNYIKQ